MKFRFSAAHFATAISEISDITLAHGAPSVGILRQETYLPQGSPGAPGSGVKLGVAGILGLSPGGKSSIIAKPCFNVFSTDSRITEILNVEIGRQNCFLSIIVFLLESMKVAAATSSGNKRGSGGLGGMRQLENIYVSPVIRDVCLEVFEMRDITSLFDYLSGMGFEF